MEKTICVYDDTPNKTLEAAFGKDHLEVYAKVDISVEEHDYGVPGSPSWLEVDDYDIIAIYVGEHVHSVKSLEDKYPDYVVKEILDLLDDTVTKVDLTWDLPY